MTFLIVPSDFGIDPKGPVPEEDAGTLVIPETVLPISKENIEEFIGMVDTDTNAEAGSVQSSLLSSLSS